MDVGVDTQRYPIYDPESPVLKALVREAQEQLRNTYSHTLFDRHP